MKKIFMFNLLVSALVLATPGAFAQTTQDFNTSPDAPEVSEIKPYLQTRCWQFTDFDANRFGWNPGIEGDAGMVSGTGSSVTQSSGIYSPVLEVGEDIR